MEKKKVLFIEDEPALQDSFGETLREKGYEIIRAADGEEGMQLVRREHPDLVLLDLILPKKNGFEVLGEIKADPNLKKIPVIVLTNLENPENIEKSIELGATTYLVKANYSLAEVIEKVENALK